MELGKQTLMWTYACIWSAKEPLPSGSGAYFIHFKGVEAPTRTTVRVWLLGFDLQPHFIEVVFVPTTP